MEKTILNFHFDYLTPSLSINFAKDWLDQLFLFLCDPCGLEKDHEGAVSNHFSVYMAIFGVVTNERRNTQTKLKTTEKKFFCKSNQSLLIIIITALVVVLWPQQPFYRGL